jgi:catechol 2,3-dioxygenase-like lactoylglutathione lyase family enzyme
MDRSIGFYTRILGGNLLERKKFKKREMAWIGIGDVRLEIFTKREGEQLNQWSDYTVGPVHIAFLVPEVGEFLTEAQKMGAQLHPSHPEPFVPVPGGRPIAYLLGPDGEEVEIRDAR